MFHCKFLIIITIAPARLSWMSSPGPVLVTASCSSLLRMMSMLMVAGLMLSGKHLYTPAVSSPTWHQITLIYLNGWLKRKRRRLNWFRGFPHILQFSTCRPVWGGAIMCYYAQHNYANNIVCNSFLWILHYIRVPFRSQQSLTNTDYFTANKPSRLAGLWFTTH